MISYLQQIFGQKLRPSKSYDRIQIFLHGVRFEAELMREVSCDSKYLISVSYFGVDRCRSVKWQRLFWPILY